MDDLTPKLNFENVNYIQSQIERKISENPYFANNNTVTHVITDMDHHPYSRWYRGVYYYPDAILMEREAGYRKLNNGCYAPEREMVLETQPKYCFESACSTIYPCSPKKYKEMEALESEINDRCLVEYR